MSKEDRKRRRAASERISLSTTTSSSPPSSSAERNTTSPQPAQDIVVQNYRTSSKTKEPRHVPNVNGDERRSLRVYSNKEKNYTEINVSIARDLDEGWVSEDTVKRLELKRKDNNAEDPDWGILGWQSYEIHGTTMLEWIDKGYTQDAKCRIVSCNSFDILLPSGLLTPPSLQQGVVEPPQPALNSSTVDSNTDLIDLSAEITSSSPLTDSSLEYIGQFDGDDRDVLEEMSDSSKEARRADEWIFKMKEIHSRNDPEYVRDRHIKIAVLDTGVDLTHPFIKAAKRYNRIKLMESFVEGVKNANDLHGHGTHIAALILEVAPGAQLYIAKVAEGGKIPPNHKIADAIRWAVKQKVDIITMSFGIDIHQPAMQKEIDDAYTKHILIFAAASNKGRNHPVPYPARMSSVVFCIYATDGKGNPYDDNPDELEAAGYHFATLGVAVKSKWPQPTAKLPGEIPKLLLEKEVASTGKDTPTERSGERRKTGTSYAAPIAAGIAAYILDFACVHGIGDDLYELLRTRSGMEKVFHERLIPPTKKGGPVRLDYILPWHLFAERRTDEDVMFLIKDTLRDWTGKRGQRLDGELGD